MVPDMAARKNRPPLRPGPTEWGSRRVALGLSQDQVAKLSGVQRPLISLIEQGRLMPRPSEASALLRVLEEHEAKAIG